MRTKGPYIIARNSGLEHVFVGWSSDGTSIWSAKVAEAKRYQRLRDAQEDVSLMSTQGWRYEIVNHRTVADISAEDHELFW